MSTGWICQNSWFLYSWDWTERCKQKIYEGTEGTELMIRRSQKSEKYSTLEMCYYKYSHCVSCIGVLSANLISGLSFLYLRIWRIRSQLAKSTTAMNGHQIPFQLSELLERSTKKKKKIRKLKKRSAWYAFFYGKNFFARWGCNGKWENPTRSFNRTSTASIGVKKRTKPKIKGVWEESQPPLCQYWYSVTSSLLLRGFLQTTDISVDKMRERVCGESSDEFRVRGIQGIHIRKLSF